MTTYDGIIVGGGHNGLTCAAYLARAGLNIAVVERNEVMGGGCATEELTLPGFKHNTHANYLFFEEGPVPRDLQLGRYGLRLVYPEIQHSMVFSDGTAVTIHRDTEKTAASFARFSQRDAESYLKLYDTFAVKMRPLMNQFMYSAPLTPVEAAQRVRGPLGEEMLSYAPLSLHEAVDRNFEDERIRSVFKLFLHAIALENVPGLGLFFPRLLSRLTNLAIVDGGTAQVAEALCQVLREAGATLITGRHVAGIEVSEGRATGVRLADGEILQASRFVASGVDAPQTIRLAGEDNFDASIVEGVRNYRWASHALVTLHLALNEPPRYAAAAFDPDVDQAFDVMWGVDTGREINEQFEVIARGGLPERLVGNGCCNSPFASYAPPGKHVAFWWPFAPYNLDGDPANWDRRKDEISEDMLKQWGRFATNLDGSNVLGAALYTPLDIERHCINMMQGSHHVGAYLPTQIGAYRPTPELSHYRTPVEGLFLCGSSSHSGGAVTGSPGYNCANTITEDLNIGRWWEPLPQPQWDG